MYTEFFRLHQAPFSISPDPRYLFMSERHREALAHLLYGVDSGGGLVLLTGDIGTGKTTICRCFLEQVPANCNVAYIFNPKLSVNELLQAICDEFHITLPDGRQTAPSIKEYIDALNAYLLAAHANVRNNVLIIDEAQNLSPDVLEQLRLLTNLETNERKLLQIILIGQPELREMLSRPELEQLAQRVIAHYHLTALSEQETASYIQHRLATAGLNSASPFQPSLTKQIHRLTKGVPRRINLLCDRAMLGAYARNTHAIDRNMIETAGAELFINQSRQGTGTGPRPRPRPRRRAMTAGLLAGAALAAGIGYLLYDPTIVRTLAASPVSMATPEAPPAVAAPAPAAPAATPSAARPGSDDTPLASAPALLSEQDGSALAGLGNENTAIAQLAALWGLPPAGGNPCEAVRQSDVRCYWGSGGFGEIRTLDRPVAIKLQDQKKRIAHLLLTRISDTEATLRAGELSQDVSLAVLARYFHGEFVTLWHTPPGFSGAVKPGDSGPHVDWLAQQLSKLNGIEAPAAGEKYGPHMVRQVGLFQQAHGLHVDGILGPVTAMHINRAAGVEEPRLRDRR
ncbi:ExeA family protein [Noviherbaspirillum saxi]|uniref:AAA family ATPase n=1 Tax=Noviherbaspirillum saxi TaxID=2320863 RepID=A0A3A3FXC7_9BURK|nr:ExeA family protein [Noviherbaspirillum saxi]RJF99328.1 AAA family ATPase [Noviherbaspirillum saxi]